MRPFLVTRAASWPALSRSVPAGRAGSTMYLASEVESQTEIRTVSGSVTPNSASTARGSRTVRDR
jgi:hypothetical protein